MPEPKPAMVSRLMVTLPAVTAVPPAPTTILSLDPEAPSSKPRFAPPASVKAPAVPPKVRTSAVELMKLRVPAAPTLMAATPPVPKPACSVPALTVTPFAPEFQAVVPARTSLPTPVLVRLPVLLARTPGNVRTPAASATSMVAWLGPNSMVRLAESVSALAAV